MNDVTYLEVEEIRDLIKCSIMISHHPERDGLLLELLWQSGARVTEGITLKAEQIGLTSVMLRNLKQTTQIKVGDKRRRVSNPDAVKEVEVSEALCRHLKQYCDKNGILAGEYVFKSTRSPSTHVSRTYVWKLLQKAGEIARIFRFGKNDRRTGRRFHPVGPHSLRHSNAMKLLEEIGDITIVQQQLGHSNINSTLVYARAKKPKIKRAIRNIDWNKNNDSSKEETV